MKDQNLFGPADAVVNALELELADVKAEIKLCDKREARLEAERDGYNRRFERLHNALKIAQASRVAAAAKKEKAK